jgi:hypothetical protein
MERHEAEHLYRVRKDFVGVVAMGDDVEHQRVYVEFEGSMEVVVD